jgi:[calcium/calmodulin-dependent protein kinase] kinase
MQMKAAKKFKRLVDPSKGGQAMQSILGDEHEAHFVEPPMEMDDSEDFPSVGLDSGVHGPSEGGLRKFIERHPMLSAGREGSGAEGSGHSEGSFSSRPEHSPSSSRWPSGVFEPERKDSGSIRSDRSVGKAEFTHDKAYSQSASPHPALSRASSATTKRSIEGTRGHARDPLEEEFPYLFIGPSTYTGSSQEPDSSIGDPAPIFAEPESATTDEEPESAEPMQIVSESPGAAEFDIYETAYRQELERIESDTHPGAGPKVYLTRRVQNTSEVMKFVKDKALDLQIGQKKSCSAFPQNGPSGFSAAVSMLRSQMEQKRLDPEEAAEEAEQEVQLGQRPESEDQARERREPYPPSSSLSSQFLPGPETSLNEATGVPVSENAGGQGSLRRLLGLRDKS